MAVEFEVLYKNNNNKWSKSKNNVNSMQDPLKLFSCLDFYLEWESWLSCEH